MAISVSTSWSGFGAETCEGSPHRRCVADVGLEELVARMAFNLGKGGGVSGVSELVDVQNLMAAFDEETNKLGADKAGSTGNQNC